MTTITLTYEDQQSEELSFDKTVSRISVGRRPSNDVCVSERSVSGKHASITRIGDALWLEDLGSTNGTYVNGKRIDRSEIQAGDDIVIGKVHMRCRADAAPVNAPAEPSLDRSLDDSFDTSFRDADLIRADEDDDLDESMRAALALYEDDSASEPAPEPAVVDEDDDLDFSEDARLFAQSANHPAPAARADVDESVPEAAAEIAPDIAEEPMTLTDRAKVALGRQAEERPQLRAVGNDVADSASDSVNALPVNQQSQPVSATTSGVRPLADKGDNTGPTHELESSRSRGAVIQIKNGAKSGQVLPIDKPVTTLGRPGIQIAAIMRKPDGYFLMHIESDDSVDRPTLNADSIGDEPVLLHSGDELNVAGIDVEFMLS